MCSGFYFITAPGIPGTMLKEPKLFGQEPLGILDKPVELLLGAFHGGGQRLAEIQAAQFHEALAVDLVLGIAHPDGEGPGCGQGNKCLDILNRMNLNGEFPHNTSPELYKM